MTASQFSILISTLVHGFCMLQETISDKENGRLKRFYFIECVRDCIHRRYDAEWSDNVKSFGIYTGRCDANKAPIEHELENEHTNDFNATGWDFCLDPYEDESIDD